MMELGTIVRVDHPRHPFNGCVGKVVGRRGNRTPDDMWILIYFADKMRSYLVPESILSVQASAPAPDDKAPMTGSGTTKDENGVVAIKGESR